MVRKRREKKIERVKELIKVKAAEKAERYEELFERFNLDQFAIENFVYEEEP